MICIGEYVSVLVIVLIGNLFMFVWHVVVERLNTAVAVGNIKWKSRFTVAED